MQDDDKNEQTTETTTPIKLENPVSSYTPPDMIVGLQPKPRIKKLIILSAGLVILLTSATVAGFFLMKSSETPNISVITTPKVENRVSGEHRSVFAYIDGALDIQGADFVIKSEASIDNFALPFLDAKGKITRDKDSGELHAQLSVDKEFVDKKIIEFKKLIEYENRERQTDFTVHPNYELDMASLLSKLGILPTLDYAGHDIRESVPSEQTADCKASIKAYEKFITDELKTLQPNYQTTGNGQTSWTIELGNVAEKVIQQLDLFNQACYGDTSEKDRDPDDLKYKDNLILSTKHDGSNIEFRIVLDDNSYSGNEKYTVLTALLSNVQTEPSQVSVATAPSAFSLDNTSAYILAINRCRNLPVVAGGGLFGSYDYITPKNEFYSVPSFFDTGYYCSVEEAEDAGYKPNNSLSN